MHPTRITRFACFCATAAALLCSSPAAFADGLIVPRPIPGPRPRRQIPPYVKFHRVKVDVRGRIATTHVDQVFINPNRRPMEGEYVFPIPEGCAISNFTLDIDGQQVEAELLDAQRARRIYEDIVRRQKDPALLEYVDRGMFRARIFPIAPGGQRRITLSYDEEVKRHGTLFTYRYPLNTEKFSSRPIEETRVDMRITSDRPVRSVMCSSHPGDARVRTTRGGATEVNLLERGTKPDRDFVVYYGLGGDLSVDVVAHRKSGENGYFMLAISPPADDRAFRDRAKDIAFVVDTSGSMAGSKIDQVKNALSYCLNSLSRDDRFTVIRFSTDAEAYADELVSASRSEVAKAVAFVGGFRARGGTAIEDAMTLAFEATNRRRAADGRPLMIAFLTDGLPTIGERDPERLSQLVADRMPGDARVFVFGVGNNLNTKLLDRMAELGNGSRTYVAPEEDVEIAVSGFYDRIASPVLTDLKLEFDRSLDVRDVYPRKLGDLFRGDEIVVYGRYRGSFGSHAIWLRGRSERREERFVFEPGFPGAQPDNAFISRLWATRKIGYLLDEIRLRGESSELKDEVVRLSREFGILTPYTSMLVLEDEADMQGRRDRPASPTRFRGAAEAPAADAAEAMTGAVEAGAAAVRASRASEKMKKSGLESKDMLSGLKASARKTVKHLEDKTFYLSDGTWWDSTVDAEARRTTVSFMSDEYFALVKRHPKLGKYFALGERVVISFAGTVYEVKN